MTRDETKIIIKAMKSSYPNYHPDDLVDTINVWQAMLAEYDYQTISKALQRFILSDTSGFAPSIGQIVGMLDVEPGKEPLEAWALVRKAISNGTYNSEEEYAKLPIECQKAIGSPANLKEMAQMDWETVESVEQSHFIRSYQTVIRRMQEEKRLPQNMRDYTNRIVEKMKERPAIEVKENKQEEPIEVDDSRISLVELVKQRMESKKNELSEMQ